MDVTLPRSPVPVFPLPGVFLFPHQVLPLHVFEPRYRQMVRDLLDGPGRLVIGTTRASDRETEGHAPAVLPVAGFGEILRHEALPAGRFMIWVLGLARVRIEEVPSDRPYRQVRVEPFAEVDVPSADAPALARELHAATSARLSQQLPLPATAPPALLADLLLQTLRAPPAVLERAFAEPSVAVRARYVLRHAARRPPPAGDDGPPAAG